MRGADMAKIPLLPSWITKTVITTIIGALLTGALAWASQLSVKQDVHETRISVMEEHQRGLDKSLDEIKASQKEQREDTKEVLRLLHRR